jgi:hypothetical protein
MEKIVGYPAYKVISMPSLNYMFFLHSISIKKCLQFVRMQTFPM